MKKLLNIILLFIPLFGDCQMKVEEIKNNKDVLKFLKTYYLKSKKATVDYYSNLYFRNKNIEDSALQYFDTNNKYKWIKIDLNKDGRLDLIWNGCIDKKATVLAFISNDKNEYSYELISNDIEEDAFHIIKPYKNDGFILIRVDAEHIPWEVLYHLKHRFRYDTIKLSNNIFVEYNTLNESNSIDTLIIKTKGFFPSSAVLKICRDGKFIYYDEQYFGKELKRFTQSLIIQKDTLKYIFTILNNLPYYSLKMSYNYVTGNLKDGGRKYLQFTFTDGRKQDLSYYHNSAPFGLVKVYDMIMKIKQSGQWTLESE